MIEFTLNGQAVSTDVDPSTPLLWVVRDQFKLKGSKFGCGAGLCGACTMHADGTALKTCVTPIAAVAGKAITTIEGLGTPDDLHPPSGGLARPFGSPVRVLSVGPDYGGGSLVGRQSESQCR